MLSSFIKYNKKVIIFIVALILVLCGYTIYNTKVLKYREVQEEDIYKNELSKLVSENKYDEINYNLIKKDFDDTSNIIKEQITLNLENNVVAESYIVADKIYTEKLSEFTKILNNKLDKDTYELYEEDLDAFYKDVNFNVDAKKNEIISNAEFLNFKNEYNYMAKQKFLYYMLEKYKSGLI